MRIKLTSVTIHFLLAIICVVNVTNGQSSSTEYDIVLIGGRVIDPETKLDDIKNVGIIQNKIAQISSEPLKGKQSKHPAKGVFQ